jgi:hypothetical protein
MLSEAVPVSLIIPVESASDMPVIATLGAIVSSLLQRNRSACSACSVADEVSADSSRPTLAPPQPTSANAAKA